MEAASSFSKILVPVDRSESSKRALEYALKLANSNKSKVTILHVVEPLSSVPETEVAIHAVEVAAENLARELLDGLADKAQKDYGIKPELVWRVGHPADVILDVAKEKAAGSDLIVMGSRGLGGFKEMLLGSVSHAVVNHAKMPVLIVR